ncbi:MAG: hypothetical protein ACRCZK_03280, partial [Oscillospiraceae bacterium]
INENKSEFRYLPNDEIFLDEYDYSEIFELKRNDSVNKFRSIEGIAVNKFSLSKFLGKYLTISCLIKDNKETEFEMDMLKIFDAKLTIESYMFWERVIEILVINNNFELMYKFIEKIVTACSKITISHGLDVVPLKMTLLKHLYSSYVRVMALCWGEKAEKNIVSVCKLLKNTKLFCFNMDFEISVILSYRQNYCLTRMCNKYALPSLIDTVIGDEKDEKAFVNILNDKSTINLYDWNTFVQHAKFFDFAKNYYVYYPYIVTLQELEMSLFIRDIFRNKKRSNVSLHHLNDAKNLYGAMNYQVDSVSKLENVDEKELDLPNTPKELTLYANKSVSNKGKDTGIYSIAIANAKLEDKHFVGVLTDNPIRTLERYKKLSKIVNDAIAEKAEILVIPEAYVPIEWLPILARTAAKNKIAIVTGVEHIKVGVDVMNYTAVILPYIEDSSCFSHITLHNKVHYSPSETRIIKGYGCKFNEGKAYDLFCYNDLWFSVYCCFELTSITDRALFFTYSDVTIAVEWNHDTNYYSNIIESLGRDLHCYCIQVNTSDYGDSRIVKPSKTEEKDIVRTKGGKNDTVLMSDIEVYTLRNFQRKEYELQKDDKSFKPTPPNFDKEILQKKINKDLWNYLSEKS